MNDEFYSDLAQGASELIAEFGQPCVLARAGGTGVYDPSTGTVDNGVGATFNANAVKLDYEAKDIDGTAIRSGDVRFLIGFELSTEPLSNEILTLTRSGDQWKVVSVSPLDPGGFAVIYDLQARKV